MQPNQNPDASPPAGSPQPPAAPPSGETPVAVAPAQPLAQPDDQPKQDSGAGDGEVTSIEQLETAEPGPEPQQPAPPPADQPDDQAAGQPVGPEEPDQPSVVSQPQPRPPLAKPVIVGGRRKHSKAKAFVLVLVILLLAGAGGYYYMGRKQAPASAPGGAVTVKPDLPAKKSPQTNLWTGQAHSLNWGDAANWSLGTPANGQNLEIDMSKVDQPKDKDGATAFAFQNNLAGLTIGKLTVDGSVDAMLADIKGQPLTLTGGIEFTTHQTDTQKAIPQLQFDIPLVLAGDQTVRVTGRNMLAFAATADSQAVDISDKTIQLVADGQSTISFSEPVRGKGTLSFPKPAASPSGGFSFDIASPAFAGKVTVGAGNTVQAGNHTSVNNTTAANISAFGGASIEVQDGGTLELAATGTTSFTLPNDLSLSGAGVAASGNAGDHQGAVTACLTKAQEGCSAGVHVSLSGKVSLAADAQLGALYESPNSAKPTGTTVSYSIPQLDKAGHMLTVVTNSKAVIQ